MLSPQTASVPRTEQFVQLIYQMSRHQYLVHTANVSKLLQHVVTVPVDNKNLSDHPSGDHADVDPLRS